MRSEKPVIVGFIRFSSILGQTPKEAYDAIESYCRENSLHHVTFSIHDFTYGARPRALKRLLSGAKDGKFSTLVVHSLTTFALPTRELLALLSTFNHAGIKMVSLTNPELNGATTAVDVCRMFVETECALRLEKRQAAHALRRLTTREAGGHYGRPRVLTEAIGERAIELLGQKKSYREIARDLKVSKSSLHRAVILYRNSLGSGSNK